MGRRSGMMMCMVMLCMVVAAVPHAEGAITCGETFRELQPCLSYAMGRGQVTDQCCSGIRSLYAAAKTTPDRQAVCKCLKEASGSGGAGGVNLGNIQTLPGKCGVSLPYKISPSIDCATVR